MYNIGISGHRELDNPEHVKKTIRLELEKILAHRKNAAQPIHAISGLAAGADTLFAAVVLELGVPLVAVLPFPQAEYEKDFTADELPLFRQLLAKAHTTDIVTPTIPATPEERNAAYLAYGQHIVDSSNSMFLVWDGQKAAGKGGTAEIAAYAKKKRRKIIHIKAYRNEISRHHILFDLDAVKYKKRYERWWLIGILFSLAAAVLLAISVSFHDRIGKRWFATAEFCSILIALVIILYLKTGHLNKKRLNLRREAERFRVLETMVKGKFPVEEITDFDDISPAGRALEEKYIGQAPVHGDFDTSRNELAGLVSNQYDYHNNMRPKFNKTLFGLLEHSQFPLLLLFCLAVSLHTLAVWLEAECHGKLIHNLASISLLSCLIIPPVYAAIEGYIFFKEYHKIVRDSEQMKKFFTEQKLKINALPNAGPSLQDLHEIAKKIRNNMDAEIKDWYATMKQKQNPGV